MKTSKNRQVEAEQYVQSLKAARWGAWSSEETEEHLGVNKLRLKELRNSFSIVYWTDSNGRCFHPIWQFTGTLKVKSRVKEILQILSTHDTTLVLSRFLVPYIGDAGESVIELIDSGRGKQAVEYVRGLQDNH